MPQFVRGFLPAFLIIVLFAGIVGAQPGDATYRVRFDATWTVETHPVDYPGDAHFSGLVGAIHGPAVEFWAGGELATQGIKEMAEWGSQGTLLAEVQTAIDAGDARETVSTPPLWTVPGALEAVFTASTDHPLATVTCMIAPSPDWFVGTQSLSLRIGGQWLQEVVVDLYTWDAGTDSGPTYASPDQPTAPPDPVAPFDDLPLTSGVPIGTMTFTLLEVADVPESVAFSVRAYPNPFNPSLTIAWERPADGHLTVEIFDASGKRIRELWNADTAAGSGQVVWDGRDSSGNSAATGTYLYRVLAAGTKKTGRVTLLK